MSKFQDYVPQPFAIYKAMPLHPDYPDDTHYQTAQQAHCYGGKDALWKLSLPFDGSDVGFPPFMVRRPAGGGSITSWDLRKVGAGTWPTVGPISSTVEALDDDAAWEAVIFESQSLSFAPDMSAEYFIQFTDGTDTWYSERFVFVPSGPLNPSLPFETIPNKCGAQEFVQLVWSNPACVISGIFPTAGVFMLNLEANISQPEYKYKADTESDGQGGEETMFHRLEKRWTFYILAPEYIADAMAAIRMFSDVGINLQYGDTMTCRDIEVEVDWNGDCLGNVKMTFTTDFLSKTSCCN